VAHAFNPSTWKQRQADFWVRGQPGVQSGFQDSQGYTEKPCLEKPKQTNKNKKAKQTNKQAKKKNPKRLGIQWCAGSLYSNERERTSVPITMIYDKDSKGRGDSWE
jgi:hypothetical protein